MEENFACEEKPKMASNSIQPKPKMMTPSRLLQAVLYPLTSSAVLVPLIVFWGRWFTWYPFRATQTCVFGAPIPTGPPMKEGETPSEEDVAAMHAKYTAAVVELFEKHKKAAGYGPEETLKVV